MKMKKGELIQVIIMVLLTVVLIYVLFGMNRAGDPIVACSNDCYEIVGHDDKVYEYHRELLNDDEKVLYDEILESYLQFKKTLSTRLDSLTRDELRKVFKYVILDHPEVFWINNYASVNFHDAVRTDKIIRLNYFYTLDEAKKAQKDTLEMSNSIIEEAKKYETDREKIKFVHDKLIEIGTYTDYEKKDEGDFQSYVSLFRDGKTVCSGYAYAFKYIMDKLEIPSIIITDVKEDKEEESHIWNMVILDGEVYNLDITYDDQITDDEGKMSYKYFLVENPIFYLDHEMQEDVPAFYHVNKN